MGAATEPVAVEEQKDIKKDVLDALDVLVKEAKKKLKTNKRVSLVNLLILGL